jgi:hypothetical protein
MNNTRMVSAKLGEIASVDITESVQATNRLQVIVRADSTEAWQTDTKFEVWLEIHNSKH